MRTKKLLYTVKNPKVMLDAGMHRLHSLFGHQEYRKFIVLTQGRSGSNMLISMLNSHPAIYAKGEIFQRLDGRSVEQILEKIYASHPAHVQAVGFKVFYRHPLDESVTRLWDRLTEIDDLRVIHLKRRNLLRLIVSKQIAWQTNTWVNRNGKNAPIAVQDRRVTLEPEKLRAEFREIEALQARFAARFWQKPIITAYYEDLTADPSGEFARITELLDLEPCEPQASVKRQNPEPLANLIVNYDTLKAEFADSARAALFEDNE